MRTLCIVLIYFIFLVLVVVLVLERLAGDAFIYVGARPLPGERCVAREVRGMVGVARCLLPVVLFWFFQVRLAGLGSPAHKEKLCWDFVRVSAALLGCERFGQQNHTDKIIARHNRKVMIL